MREARLRSSVLPSRRDQEFRQEGAVIGRWVWLPAAILTLWLDPKVAAEEEPLPSALEENVVVSSTVAEDRRDPAVDEHDAECTR